MRNTLGFVVASVLLVAGEQVGAQATDGAGSLSTELLQIWNTQAPSAGNAATSSDYDLADFAREYSVDTGSSDLASQRGRSLTPNIDRLMSRYGNDAAVRSVETFGSAAAAPRTHANRIAGKSSSPFPPTVSGGRNDDPPGKKKEKDDEHGDDCDDGHHSPGCGHGDEDCPPVPEPGTMLLLGAAAGVAGLKAKRARAKAKRDATI